MAKRTNGRNVGGKNADNAYVVATIVLCFLVTIGLAFALSGKSFLEVAGVLAKSEERSFFMIAVGGYEDLTIARNTAEFAKERGGAGYVLNEKSEDTRQIYIVLSIYPDKVSAEKVASSLADNSAIIKEIKIKESDFAWASGELKSAVKTAVAHFDITFETLYSTSNSLEKDEITLEGVKTKIAVLYEQIKDIKSVFYEKVRDYEDARITEIKLSITTTLALLDNVSFSTKQKAVQTMRYQLVQLVLCYEALCNYI